MPSTGRPERFPPLPRQLQLEPVGQCNLRCAMCLIRFRRDGPPLSQDAFMPFAVFKRLLDQFPPDTDLHLQGLGEPLLHPRFFEMVAYAACRGMTVTTNSNGTLLDRDRAEACVQSGLAWMRVSIDGANPATYESIRPGSRLGRVLDNVGLLQAAKERSASRYPRVFLVMVAMRRNVHELKDVLRLAARHGIEQVFVQHLCNDFSGKPEAGGQESLMRDFMERESLLNEKPDRLERIFREAFDLAGELNVGLRVPRISARYPAAGGGHPRCDWPWRSVYITYNGLAMPCCMIALPERMNFGNMALHGVQPIWKSGAFAEFRSRLDSGDPPDICRSCSVYRGTF